MKATIFAFQASQKEVQNATIISQHVSIKTAKCWTRKVGKGWNKPQK